ncbi:FAD-binding domain-containing [Lecanosticta acicola]|uniref:FAD-binding domain-containing n=1 Tax=Lecanosticta acicola TaxID=111012 RepID=A0AAI9EG11_9PEZI|nr:FAD-binding domain-containing [Lecanosticta acicola]
MPCWPTDAEWQEFNQTVEGALQATVPWAKPCFSGLSFGTAYDPTECAYVEQHYADNPLVGPMNVPCGPYREAQYGSFSQLNWESCGAQDCQLQSAAPQVLQPILRKCSLGRMSAYYVAATTPEHVQSTINFCKQHNIFMSIKNTGDDYVGRSAAANSLALWTWNMKSLDYVEDWTATDCPAVQYPNVGIMGAGIAANEAEAYFTSKGMQITAGAVQSVGLAGGYGQGGGHGALGPKYGLMVDNALEFDVVTADGRVRTINQCNDPDLFFAMRGGGGSTYAVLLNYKFKVFPEVPLYFYAFQADLSPFAQQPFALPINSPALSSAVTALANNQKMFVDNNISSYNFYYPQRVETYQVLPAGDEDALARFKDLNAAYQAALEAIPGATIKQNEYLTFQHQTDFADYTTSTAVRNTPQGYAEALAGRFIPRSQFNDDASIATLVKAFLAGLQESQNPLDALKPIAAQVYVTGPSGPNAPNQDGSETGVNTAWRDELWEVVYAGGWVQGTPQAAQDAITGLVHTSMDNLRDITPGGGCYMNEADVLEDDWQTAFFGENYGRLLDIKKQYDPTNFFNCWKCVGWTGAADPLYSCYAQSMNPLVATNPL